MARKTYLERLAEIAKEYDERLRPEELVQSRLRWDNWETLRKEAVVLARQEIRRRRWRGSRKGVLPKGYDAEDVADQAIKEMLSGHCRLAVGFVRERIVKELLRHIQQRVRVLHRLKEASSTRSEWDVKPRRADGTPVSVLREIEDEHASSDEAVARKEEEERRKRLINKFESFLEKEPELLALFCEMREGVTDLKELGQKLGMDEQGVSRCRKRLARRAAVFAERNGGS